MVIADYIRSFCHQVDCYQVSSKVWIDEEIPGGLYAAIAKHGKNLSAGSRQLLVFCRSPLPRCRIFLLDEATSNVDYENECEIQHTIRVCESFVRTTALTIAHRVDTIMDSDKILVMKEGTVVKFDTAQALLRDETSMLSNILRHAQKKI